MDIFGPPFCSGDMLFWLIVGKGKEGKWCDETAHTKRTYKTKQQKQTQIYISTIHAMKHSRRLLEF